MFQRSTVVVPLIRTCCAANRRPVQLQSRNIWDLVRTDPRSIMRDMNREMERMERNLFRSFPFSFAMPRLIPIDCEQPQKKIYRINIDVEGYKPEDIKISMKDNVMKIEAKMDRTAEDGSRLQQQFVREFTVPENIDQNSLKSVLLNDGILSIEAGLVNNEDTPKDIPIQIENGAPKSKM